MLFVVVTSMPIAEQILFTYLMLKSQILLGFQSELRLYFEIKQYMSLTVVYGFMVKSSLIRKKLLNVIIQSTILSLLALSVIFSCTLILFVPCATPSSEARLHDIIL